MALVGPKKTQRSTDGGILNVGVKATVQCFAGGLAVLAAGLARPGRAGIGIDAAAQAADAATYRAVGIFTETVLGGAADGLVKTDVQQGIFLFKNSAAGDLLTVADIGRRCFVVDDETVAKTSAVNTRCVAGAVHSVLPEGVLVEVSAGLSAAFAA